MIFPKIDNVKTNIILAELIPALATNPGARLHKSPSQKYRQLKTPVHLSRPTTPFAESLHIIS